VRWLLVLHAVFGVAAVAATTHWIVWMWPFRRGAYGRLRGARRFGVIAMALYGLAMSAGLLLYPTYKTRVKLEYLTSPEAVGADAAARAQAEDRLRRRWEAQPPATIAPASDEAAVARAARVARWFDVKEHWVALGVVLGLATLATLLAWDPRADGRGPR